MSNITTEIRNEIMSLTAEGKAPGKIAQLLKIKKVLIQEVIDNAANASEAIEGEVLTQETSTSPVVLQEDADVIVVEEAASNEENTEVLEEAAEENSKASKLAAMLLSASKAKEAKEAKAEANKENAVDGIIGTTRGGNIKYVKSSSKDETGSNKQRRNYEVKTRKIAVFKSAKLNEAFISTNLAFATKTYDGAIKHIKQAKQKALQNLLAADDFMMELVDQAINVGEELNDAKGEVYDKLNAENWNVLCNRPKTSFETNSRLPVQATDATEATEEVVEEVVVEENNSTEAVEA